MGFQIRNPKSGEWVLILLGVLALLQLLRALGII